MARLRDAIEWIALNDSPGDPDANDVEAVSGLVSVLMVADLWKKTPEQIARRVIGLRQVEGLVEGWDADLIELFEKCDAGKPIRRGDR